MRILAGPDPTKARRWLVLALALTAGACSDEAGGLDADAAGDADALIDASDAADVGAPDGSAGDANVPDGLTNSDGGDTDAPDTDFDTETDAGEIDPSVIVPVFDLAGTDFFDTPWPSDHRLHPDGTPDLSNFPGANVGLMPTFRAAIEGVVDGYSTMPVVYVHFAGPLRGVVLPEPKVTLRPGSIAQLIDVSEAGCGRRVPVVLSIDSVGDRYRPVNTLSASPVPGFALDPSGTYAFVLRREFGLEAGRRIATPAVLEAALRGEGDPGLVASVAPFVRCMADDDLSLDAVGVVTVFSTQDPSSELQTIRDHVVDPERVAPPVVSGLAIDPAISAEGVATTWRGTYETPIYQRGVPPYTAGGAFAFVDGEPEIQRMEAVPFIIGIPDHGEGPYPVLVFLDGTGATLNRVLAREPVWSALAEGFAVASFAPQFHDSRAVPGSEPITHGFNYLNPVSGRTVFRQQAVDTSYFVRVLREGLAGTDVADMIDTTTLVYGGHSQGGIVGSFVAGVESEFAAYVLNGTGTYISVTVIQRTDPIDIPGLIEEFFDINRDLDVQHPLVQLVQLGTDVVEPHNYAPYWRGRAGDPGGSHVLIINGYNDTTTFPPSMDAMTISADLDVVAPAGWDVDPFDVWDRAGERATPFAGNREALDGSPLTFASFLDREGNHFTWRTNERARSIALRFWREALAGVPSIE